MINSLKIIGSNGQEYESSHSCLSISQVVWDFLGRNYKIDVDYNKNQNIYPCLTPSKEKIVAVFQGYSEYQPPNNALILNPDGSVYERLNMPRLTSQKYKNYERQVGKQNAEQSKRFLNPFIAKMEDGTEKLTMCIGFNLDWFDVVELDSDSGEFKETLWTTKL